MDLISPLKEDEWKEGRIVLDEETYCLLKKASELSFRSLKKEAALRVIDHALRFETCNEQKIVDIHFKTSIKIPRTTKDKLDKCLYRKEYKVKTLVDECSKRLKDHLLKFPLISAIGVVNDS